MMSRVLRVGLRPCFAQPTAFLQSSTARVSKSVRSACTTRLGTPSAALRNPPRGLPLLLTAVGVAGTALGIASVTISSTLHCDDVPPSGSSASLPPPPKSSVNVYELTFGTVCGLCAGVFVVKSARVLAFFLGGLFVVLQYLGSESLIRVDWPRIASRFENLFYRTDAAGNRKPPTVWSIWKWMVDFLTADFQPRASFVAGFALGLRIG